MATKFILHGGYAGRPNKENDKFFRQILSTEKKNLKILLVYFAKTSADYERVKKEDHFQFNKNKGGKELSFEVAAADKFDKQVKRADIVYLHGGNTLKLLKALKKYPDLPELFQDKLIVGESAGAYVLSACFYSKSEGDCFEGLGFVPVKTICHYIGKNSEMLDQCPLSLEKLLLKDYEFRIFDIIIN